jgi:hypothetical protein
MFARLVWEGHGIGFEPAALVFHHHRDDEPALKSQIEAYGIGFVATILALIVEDRRHVGALVAAIPETGTQFARSVWRKLRNGGPGDPHAPTVSARSELALIELRGMAKGPAAYLRSWRQARR